MTLGDAGHTGSASHSSLNGVSFHFSHPFNSQVKEMESEDFRHFSGISGYFRVWSKKQLLFPDISYLWECIHVVQGHGFLSRKTWMETWEPVLDHQLMTCWRFLGCQRLHLTSPGSCTRLPQDSGLSRLSWESQEDHLLKQESPRWSLGSSEISGSGEQMGQVLLQPVQQTGIWRISVNVYFQCLPFDKEQVIH